MKRRKLFKRRKGRKSIGQWDVMDAGGSVTKDRYCPRTLKIGLLTTLENAIILQNPEDFLFRKSKKQIFW